MSDIFREIDEDVRREQYLKLWKRYGRHVIAAALLVVLGTAAYVGVTRYLQAAREEEGRRFAAAISAREAGEIDRALDELRALGADAGGGYGILARFQQASLLIERGAREEALDIYDAISASSGVPSRFRDLARLMAAIAILDEAPREEIARRLAPLDVPGNPWSSSARELMALAAFKAGDRDEARALFAELADDPGAPRGARARAAEFLALMRQSPN